MGQLGNGMRSLFIESEEPADVLAALDRQLAAASASVASSICARYRDGVLTWSNAGHPPLLVVPTTGPSRYLDADPSPMLGLGTSTYATHTAAIGEGEAVIAFTDGLIEHRSWSLGDALDHLVAVAGATTRRDPESRCDALLASGLGGRRREDDACILVMQRR
jgi:serine phosphatase RsbU (regulator of sigma subunit)